MHELVLPMPLPDEESPIASAWFLWKCMEINAGAGRYRHPNLIPIVIPCARKHYQYRLQRLAIKNPSTESVDPVQRRERRCPASKMGPMKKENRNMKHPWTDPIQEISESEDAVKRWIE